MPESSTKDSSVQDYTFIRYLHATPTANAQSYDNINGLLQRPSTTLQAHGFRDLLRLRPDTEGLAGSGFRADGSLSVWEMPLHLSTCRAPMRMRHTSCNAIVLM